MEAVQEEAEEGVEVVQEGEEEGEEEGPGSSTQGERREIPTREKKKRRRSHVSCGT